jgi:hypothetical protein
MRNPKVYGKFVQLFMYDFVITYTLFLMSFLCIVCERFLVKLTFVEVHDKKESKLFSLASCTN